ncbi:hypothetical protein ARMSODRAFT_31185 [Armillaria solidipes]|uniref:Expansin-like EG45 domain-containing protein n=1 Tax=Armillaria solidipes TaxID=1076256 RepID=A0A2H3CA83_9AGAR|nr:hypothetical protein ARMSODRAFT_31185 [Armillaria solidipes]
MFASLATFALVAIAAVQASPHFPRRGLHGFHHVARSKPADYAEGYLEAYDVYHARYLAIGCQNQHNTQFFDDCCHPLLATETVAANRPAYCAVNATASASVSASASSSASAVVATPTDTSDDSGDDDCDDEDSSSSSDYVPATTSSSSSSSFSQPTSAFTSEASSSSSFSDSSSSSSSDSSSSSFSDSSSPSFSSSSFSSSSSVSVTQDSTPTPDPTPSSTQEQNTEAQKNTQTQEAPSSSSSSETAQSTGTSNASSGSSSSSGGTFYSGGVGTFYYQYGVKGSCGDVHADSDKIVAISAIVMNSSLCGKTITLTNTANGKTVDAVIADTCPGCYAGGASIDCSTGTFDALADESDGTFPGKCFHLYLLHESHVPSSHVHSPYLRPSLSSTACPCSYTYTPAGTFLFLTSFAHMSGRRRPKAFHLPYTIDTGFHDKC